MPDDAENKPRQSDPVAHHTLDYGRPTYEPAPNTVGAVALFIGGMFVSILASTFISAILFLVCINGGWGGAILGCAIFVAGVVIPVISSIRMYKRDRTAFFALGFLCGIAMTFLLEGICFGSLIASRQPPSVGN